MATFEEALYKLWPHGDEKIPGLRKAIVDSAPRVFENYGLNAKHAMQQFMAQISHECGAGLEVEENLNYSAQRMTEVWPKRFPTVASATPYAHNPRLLANKVYNGQKFDGSDRMGNRPNTDDGWNYRGRGATQVTGRANYAKLGAKLGLDLIRNPDLVNDPTHFLECGVVDFILCGCLEPAIIDDLDTVTLRLNGGRIGIDDRWVWLHKWDSMNVSIPTFTGRVVIPAKPSPSPQPQASGGGFWEGLLAAIAAIFKGFKRG